MTTTSTLSHLSHSIGPLVGLLLLTCGPAVAAQQSPDDLKQRVLEQANNISPDQFAFTRTIRTEQISKGKTEKKVVVERFDPTKPADERWMLLSIDGAAPSADALNDFRKDAAKRRVVPGYHRLAGYFGSSATASTDSHGRTVLHFAALPKDAVRVFDNDVSQNATAEATLGEADGAPFVEQVRITVRPMRMKLIMKLDRYESTAHYRIGAEGKPVLTEQTSDMAGSGMGQEGRAHTVSSYSDYRLVRH